MERIEGHTVVASVSGGKDSAAMCLHLKDIGVPYRAVFLDTGWESKLTYEYLRGPLTEAIGPIIETRLDVPLEGRRLELALEFEERMGHYSAMVRLCLKKSMFPSRQIRWCTQLLKVSAMESYLESMEEDPVNCVGIRNDESRARSKMETWEWSDTFDCWVWRPIRTWTTEDVIAAHHAHGLLPNPHYLKGSERVGCWPCIHARKSELAALGRFGQDRVELMADLERVVGELVTERLDGAPEVMPAWFQSRKDTRVFTPCEPCGGTGKQESQTREDGGMFGPVLGVENCSVCKGKGKTRGKLQGPVRWPIDQAVAYGLGTDSPGLFAPRFQDQGCMRWGLCDHGKD